jgi:putative Holliday junction resolvase
LIPFLLDYVKQEQVELMLIGMPKNWDDTDTHGTPLVKDAIAKIKKSLPQIPLLEVDERYTSKLARQAMLEMGMKKKEREKKGNVDVIAATIMLQEYLQSKT